MDCGTKFGYEEYPALECDFRLKSYKKPTCTESGLIVYECTLGCGRRQEETVAPLGHDYEVKDGVAPPVKLPVTLLMQSVNNADIQKSHLRLYLHFLTIFQLFHT